MAVTGRFKGRYTHAVDGKNRVSVPRKILETLRAISSGDEVVLTVGLDGCLFLYTGEGFDAMGSDVDARPVGEEAVRDFARSFYTNAETCAIDRSGRMLIPEGLKQRAGIADRVVFAGVGRRVELWAPDRFEARMDGAAGEYEQQAKEIFR